MNIYTDCKVKVKEKITHPTYLNLNISGWHGTAIKISPNKNNYYVDIDLDEETIKALPNAYINYCKNNNLNYKRIILDIDKLERV